MNQQLNILIVDDETAARKKIKSYLAQGSYSYHLIEAENGFKAIEQIRQHPINLVLLDIQMPGMNGFEVIQQIGSKQMPPVIFITAYDQYAIDDILCHRFFPI